MMHTDPKTAEKSGLSPTLSPGQRSGPAASFHLNIAPIGIGVPTFTHQGIPVNHQAFLPRPT